MKAEFLKGFAFFVIASAVACLSVANARTVVESQGPEPSPTELQQAEEHAAQIISVEDYLQHLDEQTNLFDSGDRGRASHTDRRRLQSANTRIRELLEGHHSATDLTPPNQVALFNAQEEFDAVVFNLSDPVICTRERRTGSHLYVNTCLRQSEIQRRSDADRDAMSRPRQTAPARPIDL